MIVYFTVAAGAILFAALSDVLVRHSAVERAARARRPFGLFGVSLWTPFDVFAIVILVAFVAMRSISVGTDTRTYADIFASIPASDPLPIVLDHSPQEIGYTTLSYVVKSVGGDFAALLWVTSGITVVCAYWAIKRASSDTAFSLALFIFLAHYLLQFNIIRQGMAASILLLAATFLGRRKGWVAYTVLAAVASTLHASAVVATVAIFLVQKWKATPRRLIVVSVLAALLGAALWASPWLKGLVESLNPRYGSYLDWEIQAGLGTYLLIATQGLLLLYAVKLHPNLKDMKYAAWSTAGVACLIIGTQSIIAARVGSYFLIFLCILIPNVTRDKGVPKAHLVTILVASAVFFGFHLSHFGGVLPYSFAPLGL